MPSKKPSAEPTATQDEIRKTWEETIRAAVHPDDYKIKNIDDVIPVADEAKVSIEEKVDINEK